MTFPLWYLLIPYAVILFGTGLFLFFNLYHVAAFGIKGGSTTMLLSLYTLSYAAILIPSLILLSSFDWSATSSLGDIIPFLSNEGASSPSFGL